MKLLAMSTTTYQCFQEIFMKMYDAFNKGKPFVIIRQFRYGQEKTENDYQGTESYYHAKRVVANLNLQGYVKFYRRKPPKPADWKPGDKVYSYLEVHPTKKGFKAFKKGSFCHVEKQKLGWNPPVYSADRVGVGKSFATYNQLLKDTWTPKRKRLGVAISRWYNWTKEFDELYAQKLVTLKKKKAIKEIDELVARLVPTLPQRKSRVKMLQALEKTAKLEDFVTA